MPVDTEYSYPGDINTHISRLQGQRLLIINSLQSQKILASFQGSDRWEMRRWWHMIWSPRASRAVSSLGAGWWVWHRGQGYRERRASIMGEDDREGTGQETRRHWALEEGQPARVGTQAQEEDPTSTKGELEVNWPQPALRQGPGEGVTSCCQLGFESGAEPCFVQRAGFGLEFSPVSLGNYVLSWPC